MLGKTNACVGGSGGGSGETIEVLNKTGAVINPGDKVWLSENTQSANTSYILDSGSANFGSYGFINSSGLVAYGSKGKYSLDATSGTLIDSSFTIFPYLLYYTSAGCMYYRQRSGGASGLGVYFITPTGEVSWTMPTLINSNGYSVSTSSSVSTIKKYNTLTQELEQTWETALPSSSYAVYFVVKNMVYVGYSNAFKYKTLYDDGTVSESWIDATKPSSLPSANCIIGNTLDEKYIVSIGNNYNYGFQKGGAKLQMWETLDSGDIVYLTQSEMPADLQKYVDGNNLITFNPKNGVLAVCKYNEQTYDIVKYENETWTKLPIQLNLEEGETFESAITLSEDLTRACVRTTNGAKIFNLTDLDGYTAISYNPSVINENTITATALAESQPNELTQVQIGSVTNEDLTVTENGTYTPSATYTGFGSVNVNVKGAEKIEAVNKTGAVINQGDKVWLKPNGDSYEVESFESDYENFVNVGGVNINDKTATGFSTSRYLRAQLFNPKDNPWELVLKFKYNSDFNKSSTPYYFWTKPSNSRYGLALGTEILPEDPKIRFWMYLSTNGTSWENWNGWNEDRAGWEDFNFSLDTVYWVRLSWNGTEYKAEYSTDGETFNLISTYASSSPIHYPLNETIVGQYYNMEFAKGMTIYLDGCYGKINGDKVWSLYYNAINEDWITGYAMTDAEPNETVTVSVPAEV